MLCLFCVRRKEKLNDLSNIAKTMLLCMLLILLSRWINSVLHNGQSTCESPKLYTVCICMSPALDCGYTPWRLD